MPLSLLILKTITCQQKHLGLSPSLSQFLETKKNKETGLFHFLYCFPSKNKIYGMYRKSEKYLKINISCQNMLRVIEDRRFRSASLLES